MNASTQQDRRPYLRPRNLLSALGEDRCSGGAPPTNYRYTGQRSEPDLGLYFYKSRWYDPSLGRWAQPDTIVPNPGNPLDWDRYSYVRNNPLKYIDPTGHETSCSLALDDECVEKNSGQKNKRPTIDLTSYGQDVADLFDLFVNTNGWWQKLIAQGTDAFTLFYSIMLSRESQPLWQDKVYSGWGSGGTGDAKTWFSRAATHWLWGWTKDLYGISFGKLSSQGQKNIVFNLLGRWESVEGIMNAVLGRTKSGSPDSQYGGSQEENLSKVLQISGFNDETISIAKRALRGPASGYWTWGNVPNRKLIPADAVYRHDNFYILNRYR